MTNEQYVELAIDLLMRGTDFQKKNIRYLLEQGMEFESYVRRVKELLDIQIRLNKVNPAILRDVRGY